LVTGGTGRVGAPLVQRLREQGFDVRYTSRRADPTDPDRFAVDLLTGEGLTAALDGVHTVIHCASSPFRRTRATDVDGTQRLIDQMQDAGCAHLVYISIVGIDRVPIHYYQQKCNAEALIEAGRVPWSILRATQFHPFIDGMLWPLRWFPILPLPLGYRVQPVDVGTVVDALVQAAASGPQQRLPDLGGPEILTLREITDQWLRARQRWCLRLPIPAIGRAMREIEAGALCCEPGTGPSWREWCERPPERG